MTIMPTTDFQAVLDLEQGQHSDDIAFFTQTALEAGGPILELGCGAGRLAIPIARAGVEIVGIDISNAALEHFGKKLRAEACETRQRVRFLLADMKRFSLKRQFRGAFCSSNTLFLLGSESAVTETLACVGRHLAPGGILIVDTAAIDTETRAALAQYPQCDVPDIEVREDSTCHSIRRTHRIEPKIDAACNEEESWYMTRFSVTYKYFDAPDSLRSERTEDIVLLTPEELMHALREQGYEIIETFGWYNRRRFADGERKLIVLARKRGDV